MIVPVTDGFCVTDPPTTWAAIVGGYLFGFSTAELPYLTVRLGYLACDHFNADTGLALVRPDHQAFYRRVLLSETIAEPRPFPSFSG